MTPQMVRLMDRLAKGETVLSIFPSGYEVRLKAENGKLFRQTRSLINKHEWGDWHAQLEVWMCNIVDYADHQQPSIVEPELTLEDRCIEI